MWVIEFDFENQRLLFFSISTEIQFPMPKNKRENWTGEFGFLRKKNMFFQLYLKNFAWKRFHSRSFHRKWNISNRRQFNVDVDRIRIPYVRSYTIQLQAFRVRKHSSHNNRFDRLRYNRATLRMQSKTTVHHYRCILKSILCLFISFVRHAIPLYWLTHHRLNWLSF